MRGIYHVTYFKEDYMKKVLVLLMVLLVATTMFAQGAKDAPAETSGKPTIRLLTDATGIDDKSFNAAAWKGIVTFYGDTVENPANRGKQIGRAHV